MRVAALPGGLKLTFPAGTSDTDMDMAVKKYLMSTEFAENMANISDTLKSVVTALSKISDDSNKHKEELIGALNQIGIDVAKSVSAIKIDSAPIQKSIDIMSKTSTAAALKIADSLKGLTAAMQAPIEFKTDSEGNITGTA